MILMKIWVPLTALVAWSTDASVLAGKPGPSPIARVIKMLDGIQAKIQLQGKLEQASFDKFDTWCEKTITGAANDISKGKASIEDLQNTIVQLKGNLGSLGATIKQLKSDVAANLESQKEAEGVREGEHSSYAEEKAEAEQCLGALKTSIKVMSGKKFLQNGAHGAYEEAQLMSVAADVRGLLQRPMAHKLMSQEDLKVVHAFVSHPGGEVSALQMGQSQNPFGDYAPQSDQIQGILKGLYDSFVANLEKSNKDEANSQKAFEDLMSTKAQELKTLNKALDGNELDSAEKTRTLAESKEQLDDTKADLKSDEALFAQTKDNCKEKADEWSQRSELRDMELQGIKKATAILTSPEAVKAFKGAAAASLVQLEQTQHRAARVRSHAGVSRALRNHAYAKLRSLAAEYDSLSAARIAVQVKSGGPMDKVIMMIDMMIDELGKEGQEDIAHRDRCENSENANSNEKDDLEHSGGKMTDVLTRLKDSFKAKTKALNANEQDREDIEGEMKDRLKLRNEEHEEFKRALEADTNAVKVIGLAQKALAEFYEKTGPAPKKLLQMASVTTKPAAPKVAWDKKEGGKYGGQKSMNKGAMGALDMIMEDLQKEINTGKAEDDENQAQYAKEAAAMEEALKAKKDTIEAVEKQLAELGVKIEDKEANLAQNGEDTKEAEEMTKALKVDCAWVKTHFDKRHKAREAEIAGLQEAKAHLSKAGQGGEEDDDLDMDAE